MADTVRSDEVNPACSTGRVLRPELVSWQAGGQGWGCDPGHAPWSPLPTWDLPGLQRQRMQPERCPPCPGPIGALGPQPYSPPEGGPRSLPEWPDPAVASTVLSGLGRQRAFPAEVP